jgi:hypothetical protein
MYANAHALVAPISSNTAPKSQVRRDKVIALTTREEVKMRWRLGWKGSVGK